MVSARTGRLQLLVHHDISGLVCSIPQQSQRLLHQEWGMVAMLTDIDRECLAAPWLGICSMVDTIAMSGCQACGAGAGSLGACDSFIHSMPRAQPQQLKQCF